MAETQTPGGEGLYIAVSSPDLNFNMSSSRTTRPLKKSSDLTSDEIFYLNSGPVNVKVISIQKTTHRFCTPLTFDEQSLDRSNFLVKNNHVT